MCDKVVHTHRPTIKYISECCKTQEMGNKTVHKCFFYLILLIKRKFKKGVTNMFFLIFFFNSILPDKYITRRMCEKAVDVF